MSWKRKTPRPETATPPKFGPLFNWPLFFFLTASTTLLQVRQLGFDQQVDRLVSSVWTKAVIVGLARGHGFCFPWSHGTMNRGLDITVSGIVCGCPSVACKWCAYYIHVSGNWRCRSGEVGLATYMAAAAVSDAGRASSLTTLHICILRALLDAPSNDQKRRRHLDETGLVAPRRQAARHVVPEGQNKLRSRRTDSSAPSAGCRINNHHHPRYAETREALVLVDLTWRHAVTRGREKEIRDTGARAWPDDASFHTGTTTFS
ncbi:hypothetical protein QBC43DRAFT_23084 [Cladorrhinum sp. PSN259]|nr:hypothetical protein QBC43DRAFT_23084 [Cladorrhinum sp. PSN259]